VSVSRSSDTVQGSAAYTGPRTCQGQILPLPGLRI
jgi:hypothetical protein